VLCFLLDQDYVITCSCSFSSFVVIDLTLISFFIDLIVTSDFFRTLIIYPPILLSLYTHHLYAKHIIFQHIMSSNSIKNHHLLWQNTSFSFMYFNFICGKFVVFILSCQILSSLMSTYQADAEQRDFYTLFKYLKQIKVCYNETHHQYEQ